MEVQILLRINRMPVREYTINPGETIKITCGATAPASGNAKLFNPFNNFDFYIG